MIMPFGKYKDTPVEKLPLDYCQWLLKTVKFTNTTLKKNVQWRILQLEQQADDLEELNTDSDDIPF